MSCTIIAGAIGLIIGFIVSLVILGIVTSNCIYKYECMAESQQKMITDIQKENDRLKKLLSKVNMNKPLTEKVGNMLRGKQKDIFY